MSISEKAQDWPLSPSMTSAPGKPGDTSTSNSSIDHPKHYGGADDPYEAIKVIEAWDLNFNLGNVLKYIQRAGKKDERLETYKKAAWYMNREVQRLENLK